jgi:hypothetical protein
MASKPADLPHFADAQTDVDATTTAMSAGEQNQGIHVDEIPASPKWNWLLNRICQWLAYVSASFRTDGAGVRYSDRVLQLSIEAAASGNSGADWVYGISAGVGRWNASGGSKLLSAALPVAVGDRIKGVTAVVDDVGGAAVRMQLWDVNVSASTAAQIGSNQDSTGTGVQTLTLSGLTTVAAAGHAYHLVITSGQILDGYLGGTLTTDCVT